MLKQLFTIAATTLIEAIRQPAYLVLVGVGVIMLVLAPMLAAYTLEHGMDDVMLLDMGLSNLGFWSVLLAVFTATSVLSREIEVKTVLTVVSKPVSRCVFVVGKFFGVISATALAYYLMSVVFLLTVRHGVMATASDRFDWPVLFFGFLGVFLPFIYAAGANYYFKKPFVSNFIVSTVVGLSVGFFLVLIISPAGQLQSPLHMFEDHEQRHFKLLIGMLCVLVSVLMLSSVALMCSTRLNVVPTLLICLLVAVVGIGGGSMQDWVLGSLNVSASSISDGVWSLIWQSDQTLLKKVALSIAQLLYVIWPNIQLMWPSDAVIQGKLIPMDILGQTVGYALFYTFAFVALAVALFQTREVG